MKVIFKWYDLWVGIFIDHKKEKLYLFPIPTIGLVFNLTPAIDWFWESVLKAERYETRSIDSWDVEELGWKKFMFGRWWYRVYEDFKKRQAIQTQK